MRSTGEVMGIADSFGMAFAKAQIAADGALPLEGAIFVTVNDPDKPTVTPIARRFHELGFRIFATEGTARYLRGARHSGRAGAQGARGPAQRHRPAGLGTDPAADQHAARQAHPAGRLRHPAGRAPAPGAVHDDAVGGDRRVRRDHRAARAARARCGSLQEWHALAREMSPEVDRLTAPRPGVRRGSVRGQRGAGARSRETERAGAVLDLLGSAARPRWCFRPAREDVAVRARGRSATTAGVPVVRDRARLQHPAAGRGARRARHPAGEGTRRASTRTATAGRSGPGCRRRSPRGGPRPPGSPGSHIFVGVPGHRGRRRLHERRLPRRRLVARWWSAVTVVDGAGQDAVLARADMPFTYRRSGLDGRIVLRGRRPAPARGAPGRARRGRSPRCSSGGSGARRSTSRAAAACSRTRRARAGSARAAPDRRPADRGGGAQGLPDRRGGGLADARELLRQHRRRPPRPTSAR